MRLLAFVLLGMAISYYWIHPIVRETPVLRDSEYFTGQAKGVQYASGRYVQEKPAGKFPDEIVEMFHEIVPYEDGWTYYEPDSGNTVFHWLNVWSEDEVVLIETSAGYAGGSCGLRILVCQYDVDSSQWNILMEDCGVVDSVFNISHNGLLDFSVDYRWSPTARYIFDGDHYNAMDEQPILSDSQQVAKILGGLAGYPVEFDFSFEMEYVVLDSSDNPYIIACESVLERCLIHEEKPGEFRMVNKFEDTVQIDILNTTHYDMPDIRTVCWNMTNVYYRWNGRKYIEYSREEWHCPA